MELNGYLAGGVIQLADFGQDLPAEANITMTGNSLGPLADPIIAEDTVDILMGPLTVSCFNIRNNLITSTSAVGFGALDIDSTGIAGRIESQGSECAGVCASAFICLNLGGMLLILSSFCRLKLVLGMQHRCHQFALSC